jgi:hypothetical protein
MKHFVSILVLSTLVFGASAANNARPAMSGKMIMSAPRYTASINQLNAGSKVVNSGTVVTIEEEKKDMREAERNACINNNIGIGNTFVWASRNSDTSDYANMVEDVEKPENNVCFVNVELKSDDESRVKVSDIAPKYFMWGEAIECGSWADAKEMEKRILDERKGARIGGIVASTVGGAGLGVGVMELIGNNAIKDWKGQKGLEGADLYKSEILSLENSNKEADKQKAVKIRQDLKIIEDAHAANKITDEEYAKYKELIEDLKN